MMRNYAITGNRIMIDLRWCDVFNYDRETMIDIMVNELGVNLETGNPEHIARRIVNSPTIYSLGASIRSAPIKVDCSSFVQYVFRQLGISMPRPSVDQHKLGIEIERNSIESGDLVFTTGAQGYFDRDPTERGVGHVGIATSFNTVIHASYKEGKVVETPLNQFLGPKWNFRGVKRILPPKEDRLGIILPEDHEVTYALDIVRYAQKRLPLKATTPESS